MSELEVRLACPSCHLQLRVQCEWRHRQVRCPVCGATSRVAADVSCLVLLRRDPRLPPAIANTCHRGLDLFSD